MGYLDDVVRHLNGQAEPPFTETEVRSFGGKMLSLMQEMKRIDQRFSDLKGTHAKEVEALGEELRLSHLAVEDAENARDVLDLARINCGTSSKLAFAVLFAVVNFTAEVHRAMGRENKFEGT